MNHHKTVCATALLLSVFACSTPATTTSAPTKTAAQTGAVSSPGKPSAPAMVEFLRAGNVPLVGSLMSIKTVVTPTADVEALEVRFSLSEGLAASGKLPVLSLGGQKAGTPLAQTIVFSPLAEGQQYLNVFVSTQRAGQRLDKIVAYPIAVGNVTANKPATAVQIAPGEERVISMPAVEPQ